MIYKNDNTLKGRYRFLPVWRINYNGKERRNHWEL